MKTIYFITGNSNKFQEVQGILGERVEQLSIDLPEIQDFDSKVILQSKIDAAFKHHSGPFIVEDTSLYLEALNGFPGPFIKWMEKSIGAQKIYEIARDQKNTKAKAVTMIGYAKNQSSIHYVEGIMEGELVPYREGEGFGFDYVFKPNGYEQTFSEMTRAEKNQISMRKRAVDKLAHLLENE